MIAIWIGVGIALENIRLISENVIHELRERGEHWNKSNSNIAQVLKVIQPLVRLGSMMVSSIVPMFYSEA